MLDKYGNQIVEVGHGFVEGEDAYSLSAVRKARKEYDCEGVIRAVREAILEHHGLYAHAVMLLASRSIPKTSSGKLQRRKTKEQFERGALGLEGPGTESLGAKAAVAKQMARSYTAIAKNEVMSRLPDPVRAFFGRKKS